MMQKLNWLSWFIYLLSAGTILLGSIVQVKTGQSRGLHITYAGFIGLGVSGFLMTVACGAYS